jgi:hypothetical protein
MQHDPTPRAASLAALLSLAAAFAICLAVIAFSWPEPHERRRGSGPQLAECCAIHSASIVAVSRAGNQVSEGIERPQPELVADGGSKL